MAGRALLFDVGNTRLKWGVHNGERLVRTGGIDHAVLKRDGFNTLTTRLPKNVEHVLVSNVAGSSFGTKLAGVIGIHCNTDVHFARAEKTAFGIINGYRQPRRIGVDRFVAMVGARAESKSALCVVDAGTAVTIDVIDRSGRHLGGQIIPGLDMMAAALDQRTSDIGTTRRSARRVDDPMSMFAATTQTAVRNGSLNAVCGAIERALKTLRGAGHRAKIVLTGGDGSRILAMLQGNVVHRPHLVLQGLAFMLHGKS